MEGPSLPSLKKCLIPEALSVDRRAHLLSKSPCRQDVGWPEDLGPHPLCWVRTERCMCPLQGGHEVRRRCLVRHWTRVLSLGQ